MKAKKVISLLLAAFMSIVMIVPVYAQDITIDRDGEMATFTTIQEAIENAKNGETINIPAGTYQELLTVDKAITLKGEEGTILKAPDSETAKEDAAIYYALVSIASSGVTIDGIDFEGTYQQGAAQTSRGVVTYASNLQDIVIQNCSFVNLRQPGYLEATMTVKNNYVENTRGWVVCQNYKVDFTENTFQGNAVDIAIIANGVPDAGLYEDVAQISEDNTGAFVENQIAQVTAKEGNLVVESGSQYAGSLANAIAAAADGDTIQLGAGEFKVTGNEQLVIAQNNITLAGVGDETVINAEGFSCSGQAAVMITGDQVTLKDLKITYTGNNPLVSVLKITSFEEDDSGNYIPVQGGLIQNVTLEGNQDSGHGLNVHHG